MISDRLLVIFLSVLENLRSLVGESEAIALSVRLVYDRCGFEFVRGDRKK